MNYMAGLEMGLARYGESWLVQKRQDAGFRFEGRNK